MSNTSKTIYLQLPNFPNLSQHFLNLFSFLPAIITLHPCLIKFSAIAYPIPLFPPVINATLSFNKSLLFFISTTGIYFFL